MLSDCIKIHTFAVWEFFDRVKVHRLRHVNDQQSPDLGNGIKLETCAKPDAALTHVLDAANMPQHSVRLFTAFAIADHAPAIFGKAGGDFRLGAAQSQVTRFNHPNAAAVLTNCQYVYVSQLIRDFLIQSPGQLATRPRF